MLLAGSLVLGLLMGLGCSGDDGGLGQAGPDVADGSPQPIKILVGGCPPLDPVQSALLKWGELVLGTEIGTFSVADSVPSASDLSQFDAVLIWSDACFANQDSLGDALADYMDAGGGVVLLPGANIVNPTWELTGRMITPGYSPWVNGPSAGNATDPKMIDFASLSQPLHKIFNGTDPLNITFWNNGSIAEPTVEASATAIAADAGGANAIAINANGTCIGLNFFPPGTITDGHVHAIRLMGNALRCVSGNF